MGTTVSPIDAKVAWSDTKSGGDERIGTLWSDFSQNTGFHGVNKLSPGHNYKLRCFWWTLAVLGMAAYMSYNITKELLNFYSYPTVTSMKVELVKELTFPAVTVCNLSPFNKTRVRAHDPELEAFLNRTSYIGSYTAPIDWKTEFVGPMFRESKSKDWFANISMEPKYLYFQCSMGGFTSGQLYNPCTNAMSLVFTDYGLCGTFNFNASDVRKLRLTGSDSNFVMWASIMHHDYVLGTQSDAGLRVFLHDPTVHPNAATTSFVVSPGTSSYAVIKKSTFKYLPPPFKAYDSRTCIDTNAPGFVNPLEFYDTYNYEHCQMECIIRRVYNVCGCSRVQDDESLEPRCSLFIHFTCHYWKLLQLKQDSEFLDSCGCEVPCSFDKYEVKLSTTKYPSDIFADYLNSVYNATKEDLENNMVEIRIYYEELMVQSTEQIPQYTTETLIGNLGGQMGICLGASILTLTELGEFIILVCMACFRRKTRVTGAKR